MRCVIARFPFELTKGGVLESMKGIKPEPVTGESVIIGRRHYPVKQVGQVITRQDRRDFSVTAALQDPGGMEVQTRGRPVLLHGGVGNWSTTGPPSRPPAGSSSSKTSSRKPSVSTPNTAAPPSQRTRRQRHEMSVPVRFGGHRTHNLGVRRDHFLW
jgi:hypothetical protein